MRQNRRDVGQSELFESMCKRINHIRLRNFKTWQSDARRKIENFSRQALEGVKIFLPYELERVALRWIFSLGC